MIEFKLQQIQPDKPNDLESVTEAEVLNGVAENVVEQLENELGQDYCEKHPKYHNVITVLANKQTMVSTEKTDICCREFSDSINITIET